MENQTVLDEKVRLSLIYDLDKTRKSEGTAN